MVQVVLCEGVNRCCGCYAVAVGLLRGLSRRWRKAAATSTTPSAAVWGSARVRVVIGAAAAGA